MRVVPCPPPPNRGLGEHLQTSLIVVTGEEEFDGIQWVEAGGVAQHPTLPSTAPPQRSGGNPWVRSVSGTCVV